ncbi:MAG: hypothetical protein DRQ51_02990 [Gammaproteobacteria bacterium]|nr:MAG: hypothetical protein DRQ51_02990 [Gammaproteobacteria bacterium]
MAKNYPQASVFDMADYINDKDEAVAMLNQSLKLDDRSDFDNVIETIFKSDGMKKLVKHIKLRPLHNSSTIYKTHKMHLFTAKIRQRELPYSSFFL